MVEIEAQMHLGLLGSIPIVGPVHGKDGVYQRAIDHPEVSQLAVVVGEDLGCIRMKGLEHFNELEEAP